MKDGNSASGPAAVGPTEEQLSAILKNGYTLDITTGQRKYGGPPPNWEGAAPGAGHEVHAVSILLIYMSMERSW